MYPKKNFLQVIDKVNKDDTIHGVLMFRPLPAHLKAVQSEIENALDPAKDVDCMTHLSLAGVFDRQTAWIPAVYSAGMHGDPGLLRN